MRENADQNNSEYGHFYAVIYSILWKKTLLVNTQEYTDVETSLFPYLPALQKNFGDISEKSRCQVLNSCFLSSEKCRLKLAQ